MRALELIVFFLVTIVIANYFGFCRRTGFDEVPDVTLPPQPILLAASERRQLAQAVERVVEECDRQPESWEGKTRAARIYHHPNLPRFLSTLEKLLRQGNDSSKSWQIIVYESTSDNQHGDVIACPGKVLFVNTPFFERRHSDHLMAIRLAHALGHAYAGHRCWQPMRPSGIREQQRSIDEVPIALCRNSLSESPSEPELEEFQFPTLRERVNDWLENAAIFLVLWPTFVFGDSGTIENQEHEYQASYIGLYLALQAGFSIEAGVQERELEDADFGNYCRDDLNKTSFLKALDAVLNKGL